MKYSYFTGIILILACTYNSYASTPSDKDLQEWFESDEEGFTENISEGELRFLEKPPAKPSLHSINRISISHESMSTGWVLLEQCYEHLDPVAITEIVYNYESIRNLRIEKQENIDSTTLNKKSIQLENVRKNAKLCIKAEVKIFNKQADGTYSLVNGPFHRQFLHGYYPFHLSLQVNYPSSILKLVSTKPLPQNGFIVKKSVDMLYIESHFEGKLTIELLFTQIVADT
jgi:hypothetical protein